MKRASERERETSCLWKQRSSIVNRRRMFPEKRLPKKHPDVPQLSRVKSELKTIRGQMLYSCVRLVGRFWRQRVRRLRNQHQGEFHQCHTHSDEGRCPFSTTPFSSSAGYAKKSQALVCERIYVKKAVANARLWYLVTFLTNFFFYSYTPIISFDYRVKVLKYLKLKHATVYFLKCSNLI